MTQENDLNKLPIGAQVIPSEEFVVYCEAEFERRLNSGEDFDESAYRKAMEMVTAKLKQLETESAA